MKWNDAAEVVLRAKGVPLNYREIAKTIIDRGLVQSSGKSPEKTLHTSISSEIARQGKGSPTRFVFEKRGLVRLTEWEHGEQEPSLAPQARQRAPGRPRKRQALAAKSRSLSKASTTVSIIETVSITKQWVIKHGWLKPGPGRPPNIRPLFRAVAEKIPFGELNAVCKHLKQTMRGATNGVYVAHDSMGVARYIGRGDIFVRLKARQKAQDLELKYFSFYVVQAKTHEREIETLLIRAAGPQLYFNKQKKGEVIMPGNVKDYESGTLFYLRHDRRGRKSHKDIGGA